MGGGSGEEQAAAQQAAATQQPVAQALQTAQYPAYAPGEQEMLANQLARYYGSAYSGMLGNNTQSASRPTLRNPTDIETYLNNLANPASGGAASAPAQAAQAPAASPYEQTGLNQWGNPTFMGNSR